MVFGRVESGYDICERIERIPTQAGDKPFKRVVIVNCGEVKPPAPKPVEAPKEPITLSEPQAKPTEE